MRLLILGAGGIGGYFGGRLAEAGVDVTFLVRPARAEKLKGGLIIESPFGNATVPVETVTAVSEPFDAILVSCKAYDLDSAIAAIAPAVGPDTLVLPLLNGLRHYAALDAAFGAGKVAGGLAHIGVTMTPEGVIRHFNKLQIFTLGARMDGQRDAVAALHAEIERGGFKPRLSENIDQAMWDKYVLLAAFAGLTCLMRAPVGAIMEADDGEAIANAFVDECAAANGSSGKPTSPSSRVNPASRSTGAGPEAG